MTDNKTLLSAWLPVACLALSSAALCLGVPAKVARSVHRSTAFPARFANESAMRDEPIMFPAAEPARWQRSAPPAFLRR
ncbi:MAG: hypothetical protein ACHQ49_00040 [Elusimicrobiota bacterium]